LTLRIARSVMEEVRRHLEAGYPHEACGALVGHPGDGDHQVVEFHPIRNMVHDRPWDRYALDPLEQLRIQKAAEARGLEIIGFAHSHPDHPARPSRFDAEQGWPFYSYLVASIVNGKLAEATSWLLDDMEKVFREEPLELA
jgi:proteasome lid subunit RPN8/RPN11